MTRPLPPLLALALAVAPSALAGQDSTVTVTSGVCVSGDPMPVVVPPEGGAALPAPAPGSSPPVPIPNACGGRSNGTVVLRGTRFPGADPAAGPIRAAPFPGANPAPAAVRGVPFSGGEPLYVVDGVIRRRAEAGDSPVGSIPPHEIESITVLKDGTAAARYGAEAQHGVVVIQTKKAPAAPPRP